LSTTGVGIFTIKWLGMIEGNQKNFSPFTDPVTISTATTPCADNAAIAFTLCKQPV
jgi:hypothetical protein